MRSDQATTPIAENANDGYLVRAEGDRAVWLKLSGPDWIDGTALYWVTRLPEFVGFPVPYVFEHMWTIRALTWGTLAVESALACLVWVRRLRPWVLLAGVVLHLGIDWSMALALMQWVMIGAYAVFLEEEQVLRLGRAVASAKRRVSPALG